MLELTREGRVEVLRLNAPESKNSLTPADADALIDALTSAGNDDDVRVVVLTGAPPVFTAGLHTSCLMEPDKPENHRFREDRCRRMFDAFIDFSKPLIAAVNGPGVGFGATICGLVDMVLMSTSARLQAPFSSLANVPDAAATATFPALIGWQAASWFFYGGEWLDAETCRRLGLALEVFPDEALMPETMRRAGEIASRPLKALMDTKALMNRSRRAQLLLANHEELKVFADNMKGPAFREAMAAMTERRRPDYAKV